jgi:6-pyruvoyltetrahydropterin/6-carboxytetrahydropterin synthase
MARYFSTKTFDNFSIALRQWKAQHSHCQLLHGYGIWFKVWFCSNEEDIDKQLDEMNWLVDFGTFKSPPTGNGLRDWANEMFDHTVLIEKDDPYLDYFKYGATDGLMKLHVMDKMGTEGLAKLIFDKFNSVLNNTQGGRCRVYKVEVFENNKNSAGYEE